MTVHATPLHFTLLSTTLLKEISSLSRIISPNPTMPILSNLLFDITPHQATITASDLQTSAIVTLSLEASGKGRIAIPATILVETLKTLPEQPIEFVIDATHYSTTLKTKNGSYRIACENAADFPLFPSPNHQKTISMNVGVLKKAIRQTHFAAAKDDMRPALEGVNVIIDDQNTSFAATDGHHLVSYARRDTTSAEHHNFTLSLKSLQVIAQFLPENAQKINIIIDKNHVFFWNGHIQMATSPIDEPYPDYTSIIPKDNPHRLTIQTETFRNATRTLAHYANRTNYQVVLSCQEDQLKLDAEDQQFSNQAYTELPCSYHGPAMKIGLNASLLLNILTHMPTAEIDLRIKDPHSAVLLIPSHPQEEHEEFLTLIMPLTL